MLVSGGPSLVRRARAVLVLVLVEEGGAAAGAAAGVGGAVLGGGVGLGVVGAALERAELQASSASKSTWLVARGATGAVT